MDIRIIIHQKIIPLQMKNKNNFICQHMIHLILKILIRKNSINQVYQWSKKLSIKIIINYKNMLKLFQKLKLNHNQLRLL